MLGCFFQYSLPLRLYQALLPVQGHLAALHVHHLRHHNHHLHLRLRRWQCQQYIQVLLFRLKIMVGNNTYKRKGRRLQILLYIEFNELFSNLFNIFYLLDFQYLTSILMIFYLFVFQYFLPPPLHVARALPRPSSRNRLLPRLSLEATSQVSQSLLCWGILSACFSSKPKAPCVQEGARGDVWDAAAHEPAAPEPAPPPRGKVLPRRGENIRGPLCRGQVSK